MRTVRIGPEQYEVLFQVTKEFRGLAPATVLAAGAGPDQVGQILALAREIRRHLGGGTVDLELTAGPYPADPEPGPEPDSEPGPEHGPEPGPAAGSGPADPRPDPYPAGPDPALPVHVVGDGVRVRVPAGLVATWRALALRTIPALGARELFLRTGYSEERAAAAVALLAADPPAG